MHCLNSPRRVAGFIVAALLLLPQSAWCDDTWWTGFRACTVGHRSFFAAFVQETIHASGVAGTVGKGELLAASGGMLRMLWSDPPGQSLYVDGTAVYMVRPDLNATTMAPLSREPLAAALLNLLGADDSALRARFDVRLVSAPGAEDGALAVVSLTPLTQVAGVREILLVLEPGCPSLRRIVVLDTAGAAIRITFSQITFDVKIPKNAFQVPRAARRRLIRP